MDGLENISAASWATFGAVTGLLAHWTYFIRGEHHMQAPFIAVGSILLPAGFYFWLHRYGSLAVAPSVAIVFQTFGSLYTALLTSILVYRGFLHPLRRFPGPLLARLTKFHHAYLCAAVDNNYAVKAALHAKYGPIVRVGPNELSIIDANFVQSVYGIRSRCKKAAWYNSSWPLVSLHETRDQKLHDQRRKIWDKGFSIKALADFEPRQKSYVDKLDHVIEETAGAEVDASELFTFFSFDVMGELAFGKPFDMLDGKKTHAIMELLHTGMRPLIVFTAISWPMRILRHLPGALDGQYKFINWCKEQVNIRRKNEPENPDLMSWLLAADSDAEQGEVWGDNWLGGDSRLVIVAGSDTTAVTLSYVFYYLAKMPEEAEKVRAEVESLYNAGTMQDRELKGLDHLNAVINEALRMHPPVPGGLLRDTPPEGIEVNGTHIPGDVTVSIPMYPIGRSEESYEKPDEFIPERWYSKPELIHHKDAFQPFSMGKYGCIGRNLAMMEMRSVVALLVARYDVKFAPGEDGTGLHRDALDAFTLLVKELRLVFTERSAK